MTVTILRITFPFLVYLRWERIQSKLEIELLMWFPLLFRIWQKVSFFWSYWWKIVNLWFWNLCASDQAAALALDLFLYWMSNSVTSHAHNCDYELKIYSLNVLLHSPECCISVTIPTSTFTYQHVFGKSWQKGINTSKGNWSFVFLWKQFCRKNTLCPHWKWIIFFSRCCLP